MPPLEYLFKGYFHQDWDLDSPDAASVLDEFATEDPPELVAGARDEAAELLSRDLDEDELEGALVTTGLDGYYPPADGFTYRQWLELVVERLSSRLSERP